MDSTVTALVWAILILGSLIYLGYVFYSLAVKSKAAYEASKPIISSVTLLVSAVNEKPSYERPSDNLFDDVNVHLIERAKLKRRRELAAEQRQRRLIDNLKNTQESESEHA
jgi:transposase